MLPQYTIMLGARSNRRGAAAKTGAFEERDYAKIEKIVREKHKFTGCTIVRARGFFDGADEDMVQIILLEENYERVRACAHELRKAFRQNSALVVSGGVGEFLK